MELSKEQYEAIMDLFKKKSCDSLAKILKGIELDWFQTFSLAYSLITKSSLISLDTGLGKTLIACGVMEWYSKAFPHIKFLYICERSNFDQTMRKIRELTTVRVLGVTAETAQAIKTFNDANIDDVNALVLTYEAVRDWNINLALLARRRMYRAVIVDESQRLGNDLSNIHKILKGIISRAEFKMFLTATPLTVNPRQAINQFSLLEPEFFEENDIENYSRQFEVKDNETNKVCGYANLDILQEDFACNYISFTRKELGLKGKYKVHLVKCYPNMVNAKELKRNMKHLLKLSKGSDALSKTINLVKELNGRGLKGLVYANINDIKQQLRDGLASEGISVDVIDGTLSNTSRRQETVDRFEKREIDVVITNITTGLDLDCDYIIFHELTVGIKQMIGRAERGLKGNDIELYFMVVMESCEEDYFIENVYNKSVLLRELFDKDNDELERVKSLMYK